MPSVDSQPADSNKLLSPQTGLLSSQTTMHLTSVYRLSKESNNTETPTLMTPPDANYVPIQTFKVMTSIGTDQQELGTLSSDSSDNSLTGLADSAMQVRALKATRNQDLPTFDMLATPVKSARLQTLVTGLSP